MKKIGTIKKCGLTVVTLFVCFALLITGFAFTTSVYKPSAETVADTALLDGVKLPDTCDYGESFDVPVVSGTEVTVTAPDGTTVTPTSGKVAAKQLGNYVVTYTKGEISYKYNVYVKLEKDYELKVDYNGADIPTYIQKGEKFEVPGAKVVYYDDNNVMHAYSPASDVTLTVKDSFGNSYSVGDEVTASVNGKMYLTYSAAVGGANGKKYFNKTFTVNVQSTLNDTAAPTLSVAGVSGDVSVRRAVTLPQATATDSYDENVKITITVTDPDGAKVRNVDLDKYGYAYQDDDKLAADVTADGNNDTTTERNYPFVEFDNDKVMTFYPLDKGTYTVTYIATDDAGNSSSERVYYMTAADLAAPEFYSIDDYQIPETWGLNVKTSSDGSALSNSGKITFPVPVVVDNNDHMPTSAEDTEDVISVSFRITDATNSTTIVNFPNILAMSGDDNKFTSNSVYGENDTVYTFDRQNGFTFDFRLYKRKNATEDADWEGEYTVRYTAKDKANMTSSKTYTITLQENYVDDTAPTKAEVTVPSYVSVSDGEFDIPSPVTADASDSRPHVVYRVYSDNAKTDAEGGLYITVEGGEQAKIVSKDSKMYLVVNEDSEDKKELELGTQMYFFVSVTDKVGNVKYNTKDDSDDYTKSNAVVKVVPASAGKAYTYTGAIEFASAEQGDDELNAGDKILAGGFKIVTTEEMRNYTGFEVAVADENGDPLNVTLDTASVKGATDVTIYVKNISFTASKAGKHSLLVRVFDVNGISSVYGYTVDVEESPSGNITTQAAVISNDSVVNVKYKLKNETISGKGDPDKKYYVVRHISGAGVFSLMGSEFTAKTAGSYSFRDGYTTADVIEATDFDFDEAVKAETLTLASGKDGRYSYTISNNASPVIEVQGVMPSYAAKNATVTLPSVIAYTENGNAKVEVTVLDGDNRDITADTEYDETTNEYSFVGKTDGEYKITYTATYANASPVTATYSINVGDVVGPEFTYEGGTTGRMTVGDTFTFGTLTLSDPDNENADNITITKKLIDPSREEVTDATVSGAYNTYRDYGNNGSTITFGMAGTYEVVYTATDKANNETTIRYTITVVSSGSGTPTTITTLSTVLIVVAVVLLAGVIVYVVRFRKVKK
ncbi:MAG: hypothetical protein NC184_07365 [Roseburia sp.]|nr:hypothetical protein [Roseburia sp.]